VEFISKNNLKLARFKNLTGYPELFHCVTTRAGGESAVPFAGLNLGAHAGDSEGAVLANYEALSRALDFDLQKVITSHQVHGSEIACVAELPQRMNPFPFGHALEGYDGFITALPGISLMVRVADCVPVILYAPEKKTVSVVHAGWRGTAAGIVKKAAGLMVAQYGCDVSSIVAGIGPAIGPCCYEVKGEVAESFRPLPGSSRFLFQEAPDIFTLDLQEANRQQLIGAGLPPEHIEMSWLCTACNLDLFFSHRGEQGKTGRFALVAGLRA
jgi:polyphenol oxidase